MDSKENSRQEKVATTSLEDKVFGEVFNKLKRGMVSRISKIAATTLLGAILGLPALQTCTDIIYNYGRPKFSTEAIKKDITKTFNNHGIPKNYLKDKRIIISPIDWTFVDNDLVSGKSGSYNGFDGSFYINLYPYEPSPARVIFHEALHKKGRKILNTKKRREEFKILDFERQDSLSFEEEKKREMIRIYVASKNKTEQTSAKFSEEVNNKQTMIIAARRLLPEDTRDNNQELPEHKYALIGEWITGIGIAPGTLENPLYIRAKQELTAPFMKFYPDLSYPNIPNTKQEEIVAPEEIKIYQPNIGDFPQIYWARLNQWNTLTMYATHPDMRREALSAGGVIAAITGFYFLRRRPTN